MEFRAQLKSKDDLFPLITHEEAPQLTDIEIIEGQQLTEEAPHSTEASHLTDIEIIEGEQLTEGQAPQCIQPPPLTEGELYHVFLSYSSQDSEWTEFLIDELESRGLKMCCHHRDFTAGRTILENMSECISQSQKVLLIMSPDFVTSRWCLLEANMSLFTDCLQRKTIVPVLLRPVSIPLHLAHLTYLEPQHPDFIMQLLRVLCKPNDQHPGSTVVPYQPASLYNGKSLQPLTAVNEESLTKYSCGMWSTEVPDQLRPIIQEPQRYRKAMDDINKVQKRAWFSSVWARRLFLLIAVILSLCIIVFDNYATSVLLVNKNIPIVIGSCLFILLTCLSFLLCWKLCTFKRNQAKHIVRELQQAVGRANNLLCEENILMGCVSNSKLYVVYVCLDGCRSELSPSLPFREALLRYSCGYTCCLAKRHFPFVPPTQSATHLEKGICFCQYVLYNLNQKNKYSFMHLRKLCGELL